MGWEADRVLALAHAFYTFYRACATATWTTSSSSSGTLSSPSFAFKSRSTQGHARMALACFTSRG